MAEWEPSAVGGASEGAGIAAVLLRHADACDRLVRAVVADLAGLADVPVTGELGAAS